MNLARLKAAGVVKAERAGNEVYYEIDDARVPKLLCALFPKEGEK